MEDLAMDAVEFLNIFILTIHLTNNFRNNKTSK